LPRMASDPKVSGLLVGLPTSVCPLELFDCTFSVKWLPLKPNFGLFSGVTAQVKEMITKFTPDVIYIPNARCWSIDGIPTVNMIQNMEPLVYTDTENPFSEKLRNMFRKRSALNSLSKSERVLAISKYVKRFLVERVGVAPDRIGVVYHGVDLPKHGDFCRPDIVPMDWESSFLFTAGSIRPARGLEDLLLAFSLMYNKKSSIKLLIAGSIDPGMEAYKLKLDTMITKLGITPNVIWTGSLSEKEMSWCYHNCSVFVMTSRAEACPNIVLEAMAHGCVCISTEAPPMPEFFRDGAIYYPPKDGRMLGEAIQKALSWDNEKKFNVSKRARNRASQFSWDVCAERTVAVLAQAAERRMPARGMDEPSCIS
jgi:glycosyltransferase involved in cell wall biosynthesis